MRIESGCGKSSRYSWNVLKLDILSCSATVVPFDPQIMIRAIIVGYGGGNMLYSKSFTESVPADRMFVGLMKAIMDKALRCTEFHLSHIEMGNCKAQLCVCAHWPV